MISWGIVTILTGFVHTATQFYVARFFLGAAESSFFPGVIVYLTNWFCSRDRSRAIAPTASTPSIRRPVRRVTKVLRNVCHPSFYGIFSRAKHLAASGAFAQ
jgi:hypothetical protein